MAKYIFITLSLLLFLGCSSDSSSTPPVADPDDYSSDTIVNPDVAVVPHTKASIPMLTILVEYNDINITSNDANWSAKIFGTSAHELNNYYGEVSGGYFQFTPANESNGTLNDGIVKVSLAKNHPNTSISDSLFDANMYPDLNASLSAVDAQVDFAFYDTNGDLKITPDELLLTFIIAGYEEAFDQTVEKSVWAHQFCMTDSANSPTLDGVSLMGCQSGGNFALFGERHANSTTSHDATIGVIAHELGHSAFSLPDLYNTTGGLGGIGKFGLMDSGTWAYQDASELASELYGNTPVHLSAWSKVYNGWFAPVEQTGFSYLTETASPGYNIFKIPISANHYYLLENRNNNGYDKGLYSLSGTFGGGTALWHINQNKLTNQYFNYNSVNTDVLDKGVDIVEAANPTIDSGGYGDEKALFYNGNVNAYSVNTNITNVSARGALMSLDIN